MPKQTSRKAPGGITTPSNLSRSAQDVNTSSDAPVRVIQNMTDARFVIGGGDYSSPALAINPAARPDIVLSASIDHVDRIRAVLEPYRYLTSEILDDIPADDISNLLAALSSMAGEALEMLEHAAVLIQMQVQVQVREARDANA